MAIIGANPHPKKASHIRMGLIIRSSAIHAAGCYTTSPIRKGVRVAEYSGPLLTKAEADARYEASPITYLFGLGDGSMVIDGHCMAMFINHSCDANCETSEVDGRVWITAIRNIAAGEEITYDYCLYDGGDDEGICNCGKAKCRGTMYSKEEIRRRKAAVNKAALKAAKSRRRRRKSAKEIAAA
jgi:SET domain-containing protein